MDSSSSSILFPFSSLALITALSNCDEIKFNLKSFFSFSISLGEFSLLTHFLVHREAENKGAVLKWKHNIH